MQNQATTPKNVPGGEDNGHPTPTALVALGASAGGLEALTDFFREMPADSGMSFVVIQHLAPDHETMMPELLGRVTDMPVTLITDGVRAEPNHVYVISPNATISIKDGNLRSAEPTESRGHRMPIDRFFRSLADDQGEKAIAIVVSGTGRDGMLGIKSVKEAGGLVLAQESAEHDGMPTAAISTGMVDSVLPVKKMPDQLKRYAQYLENTDYRDEYSIQPDGLSRVCRLLFDRTGHDFSDYKGGTLRRRVQRRMQLVGTQSSDHYIDRMTEDPAEIPQLFQELLIGVTHFFRDPEIFETVSERIIVNILEGATSDDVVRIWVPGCCTGEEAYTLAILFQERLKEAKTRPKVQIFATDIDERALATAREGRYPEGIVDQISPERLQRFFIKESGTYKVNKVIRDMILFSPHNLIKDPPFSSLDMISCRNVLIYFGTGLQRKLITTFHYALRSGGTLLLGPSANLAGAPELFQVVEKSARIFKAREGGSRMPMTFSSRGAPRTYRQANVESNGADSADTVSRKVERLLIEHYTPTSVVVTAAGDVTYFSGRTGKYLEPAAGAPSSNVHQMARRGLRVDLRTALHQAATSETAVTRRGVRGETEDGEYVVDITVRPLSEFEREWDLFLILFSEPHEQREDTQVSIAHPGDEAVASQLEEELRATREELQMTIEQLESANEELKSSNEELLSINEELQSANEELQTSKEELQSVNEELSTVNDELQNKVAELDRTNSDLKNLFDSTRVATLFLDRDLKVKRFTPATTAVFRLIDADVGRGIADISSRLAGENLVSDFEQVMESLVPVEREVRVEETGSDYLMQVRPYRTLDDVIDGVVVTFLDVSMVKRAEEEATR
ncbi:MAG: chemotaxis protein CheB [Chthoniobacterales bacterium]